YGDVDQAAESLLWGVGTGGILGLGAGAFSEAGRTIKGAARKAAIEYGLIDEAGQIQHDNLRNMLGFGSKATEGIAGKTESELATMYRETADKISGHAEHLDDALSKASNDLRESLGVKPADLASKIEQQVLESKPGLQTPFGAAERNELSGIVKE